MLLIRKEKKQKELFSAVTKGWSVNPECFVQTHSLKEKVPQCLSIINIPAVPQAS